MPQKHETHTIPLAQIRTEGQMVREEVDPDHIQELAGSIAHHGLMQPIVVEALDSGEYQLIAGYHRLMAARQLRWNEIPATLHQVNGDPVQGLASVENLIRRDLTLAEEVEAVVRLVERDGYSVNQICDLLGKSRDWVTKRLAVVTFPADISQELMHGSISYGHAEALAQLDDPDRRGVALNQTIASRLTVRQTRELSEAYMANAEMEGAIEAGIEKAHEVQSAPPPPRRCDVCGAARGWEGLVIVHVCAHGCESAEDAERIEESQGGDAHGRQ